MKLAKLLFFFCLPAIIWHTPINAEIHHEQPISQPIENYENFSPWDLLKYENLSYDRIMNFIWEVCYGDMLENILSEKQVDEIIEFVVFLTRNGFKDDDLEGKAALEEDIKWLRGEPNSSTLDHDDEAESWFFSSLNGYKGYQVSPALMYDIKKPKILLCKGWLSKKCKQTKKFVKKHKKAVIIAAVVVIGVVLIVATDGAATPAVAAGVAAANSNEDSEKPRTPVNKPGEVHVSDYDYQPSNSNVSQENIRPTNQQKLIPQPEPCPERSILLKEAIEKQSATIKEELSEKIPDQPLNIPEVEEPTFFSQAAENARESGSWIAHNFVQSTTKFAESCGQFGQALDNDPDRRPFNEFFDADVLPFSDKLHQKIDQSFNTNNAGQYGSAARNKPSPETMGELLKDLGKDVAFCFVPIPGSQFNKISKISKTAKAIYEVAKTAGVIQATTEIATIGSTLTKPAPEQIPSVQETKEIQPSTKEQKSITVYRSVDESNGQVNYVGITNDVLRRNSEHYRTKGIKIREIEGLTNLTEYDARAIEQALIEIHKLEKNGGTLSNRINSIAKTNPKYAKSVARGAEILREIEYDGVEEALND